MQQSNKLKDTCGKCNYGRYCMVHLLIDRLVSSVPETDNKIFVLLEKYVRCVDKYLVDQETL